MTGKVKLMLCFERNQLKKKKFNGKQRNFNQKIRLQDSFTNVCYFNISNILYQVLKKKEEITYMPVK